MTSFERFQYSSLAPKSPKTTGVVNSNGYINYIHKFYSHWGLPEVLHADAGVCGFYLGSRWGWRPSNLLQACENVVPKTGGSSAAGLADVFELRVWTCHPQSAHMYSPHWIILDPFIFWAFMGNYHMNSTGSNSDAPPRNWPGLPLNMKERILGSSKQKKTYCSKVEQDILNINTSGGGLEHVSFFQNIGNVIIPSDELIWLVVWIIFYFSIYSE